jgi:hypothetical protein
MTEAEVQKLRDAGIDDAVILDLQKEEASKNGQAGPTASAQSELPEIDPNTPSSVYRQAEAAGVPTMGREQTWGQTGVEVAGVLADNWKPIVGTLGTGGLLYGGAKTGQWIKGIGDAYKTGVASNAANVATNAATQEMRVLERLARGTGPQAEAAAQRLQQLIQSRVPTSAPGPVAPSVAPTAAPAPAAGPVAPTQQPGLLQRGADMASRVRNVAAQRIAGFGASGAAVPAAVGLGGAALSTAATNQLARMTPEQRKAYYDNMMLGAMGGDTALAAAIMNGGQ